MVGTGSQIGSMSEPPYRWVIVAAGGLLGCVAFGAMFSLPVFLRPIAQDTGWRASIPLSMTLADMLNDWNDRISRG